MPVGTNVVTRTERGGCRGVGFETPVLHPETLDNSPVCYLSATLDSCRTKHLSAFILIDMFAD